MGISIATAALFGRAKRISVQSITILPEIVFRYCNSLPPEQDPGNQCNRSTCVPDDPLAGLIWYDPSYKQGTMVALIT